MAGGEEGTNLEHTPTWIVAAVCTVIVAISLAVERLLHFTGKYLKKTNKNPLFEALQKVKEELMLLGFISLLLTVSQARINKICIPKHLTRSFLPCKNKDEKNVKETGHYQSFFSAFISGTGRHLLAEEPEHGYCVEKDKVPLLSPTALHHLHIFIFVLATVHVTFCVLTIVFGGAKIRQWKHWENSIAKDKYDTHVVLKTRIPQVQQHDFFKNRFLGIGKRIAVLSWLQCFFKQFYGSVPKADYIALRLGFIKKHCKGNPKFNFHNYMIRALEADFKKVVGISWYLWIFVVIFLLLNVEGWHTYFWIAFVPFILLLVVGTKLEHVISQLADEVAEKHIAIEGDLVVRPSDDLFWLRRPQIVLFLIHITLFQNSFEIAFFFWIWVQYGFDSCIMGKIGYIIPRLVMGVIVQVLCSYSTLPLYAIVTQMGTSFKKAIFEEHIQESLVGWAHKAKIRQGLRTGHNDSNQVGSIAGSSTVTIQMKKIEQKDSVMAENNAEEINEPSTIKEELK